MAMIGMKMICKRYWGVNPLQENMQSYPTYRYKFITSFTNKYTSISTSKYIKGQAKSFYIH